MFPLANAFALFIETLAVPVFFVLNSKVIFVKSFSSNEAQFTDISPTVSEL